MSTRSCIARPTADGGWQGRYVHFDGYPEGVGEMLWVNVLTHFGGDVDAARQLYLEEHTGWSALGTRFDQVGYVEHPPLSDGDAWDAYAERHHCYCHGDRSEGGWWITSADVDSGIEWVYVMRDDGMEIIENRHSGLRSLGVIRWDLVHRAGTPTTLPADDVRRDTANRYLDGLKDVT